MSATSSAQSHGGARRADFRPPPLRPVPPSTSARAHERSSAPLVAARLISIPAVAVRHTKEPEVPAVAEGRRWWSANVTASDRTEETT